MAHEKCNHNKAKWNSNATKKSSQPASHSRTVFEINVGSGGRIVNGIKCTEITD